ncbi:hypothetical protein FISHEDRAFT_73380 [Fistulina hepatica ATCC 64428]|uniref:Uncharacterized protein n=1 Tax=Fistulina hepatica ATCC 64428 TaxID=1128425 RepID=A0A0D7ADA8_9AGAR|nr:hypothetical protein FISHEDRAFT_73380 [Fistulina hepatica ATCC 64428]
MSAPSDAFVVPSPTFPLQNDAFPFSFSVSSGVSNNANGSPLSYSKDSFSQSRFEQGPRHSTNMATVTPTATLSRASALVLMPTEPTPIGPSMGDIPQSFIQLLHHQFNLDDSQEDVLQTVMTLGQQGVALLSKADLACRLYHTAQLESIQMLLRHESNAQALQRQKGQELVQDLHKVLDEHFKLNKEQQFNVLIICDTFIDKRHQAQLSKSPEQYGMKNVFRSPHKEKAMRAFCKEMGTAERNKLQRELVASVSMRAVSLERFTYNSSAKFKMGGLDINGDVTIVAHNVLLHAATLNLLQKYGRDKLDEEGADSHGQEGSATPPSKKCKAQGRMPKGGSFWEKVEAWFNSEVLSWGKYDLSSTAWKRWVEQLTQADQALFGEYSLEDTSAGELVQGHST